MEVIFSNREFASHVFLCATLLVAALISFCVEIWYDHSHNNKIFVGTYYAKLPVYLALFVATINICNIILGLSKVTREHLEIMVSDLGHIQIKLPDADIMPDRTLSKISSEDAHESTSFERLTRQQTQERIKTAYREKYSQSPSASVLTTSDAALLEITVDSDHPSQTLAKKPYTSEMPLNDIVLSAFLMVRNHTQIKCRVTPSSSLPRVSPHASDNAPP